MDTVISINEECGFVVYGMACHDIASCIMESLEANSITYSIRKGRVYIKFTNEHCKNIVSSSLVVKHVVKTSGRPLPKRIRREYKAYLKTIIKYLQKELITSNFLTFGLDLVEDIRMMKSPVMGEVIHRALQKNIYVEGDDLLI